MKIIPPIIQQFWREKYGTFYGGSSYMMGIGMCHYWESDNNTLASYSDFSYEGIGYYLDGQKYSEEQMLSIVKNYKLFI